MKAKSKLKTVKKNLRKIKSREKCIGDESCEKKKQKIKESFWKKWLAFIREHWLLRKSKNLVSFKVKTPVSDDLRISLCEKNSGKEMLEIPIEPGQRISKILIKPTKNGIKATIAQYDDKPSEKPPKQQRENGKLIKVENVNGNPAHQNFRLSVGPAGDTDMSSSTQNIWTSALYVRDNANVIAESTDSDETILSLKFSVSEHISSMESGRQKWDFVREKMNESGNDEEKTLKSISEPCWSEKRKIIRRKKIQENIYNLIEQFKFLESDDLFSNENYYVNFAKVFKVRNEPKQDERKLRRLNPCNSTFPLTNVNNRTFLAEASRQVSPEVLVNIKPFKEYTTKRGLQIQNADKRRDKTMQRIKKINLSPVEANKNKISENYQLQIYENSQTTDQFKKMKNEKLKFYSPANEHGNSEILKKVASLDVYESSLTEENKNDKSSGNDNNLKEESIGLDTSESVVCSVWGIYRSYIDLEKLVGKNSVGKIDTLEELLDSFDDKDHDVIFRQNISQFKKPILRKSYEHATSCQSFTISSLAERFCAKNEMDFEENLKKSSINTETMSRQNKDQVINELRQLKSTKLNNVPKVFSSAIKVAKLYNVRKCLQIYTLVLFKWILNRRRTAEMTEAYFVTKSQYSREIFMLTEINYKIQIKKMFPELGNNALTELHKKENLNLSLKNNFFEKKSYEYFVPEVITRGRLNENESLNSAQVKVDEPNVDFFGVNDLFWQAPGCFYFMNVKQTSQENFENSFLFLCHTNKSSFSSIGFQSKTGHWRILSVPFAAVRQAIQILNNSNLNFVVEISDSKNISSFLVSFSSTLSLASFTGLTSSKTLMKGKRKSEYEYKFDNISLKSECDKKFGRLDFESENKIITSNFEESNKEKQISANPGSDVRTDGFSILYNGFFKKYPDFYENGHVVSLKFGKSVVLDYKTASEVFTTKGESREISIKKIPKSKDEKERLKSLVFSQPRFFSISDKIKPAKLLKCKCISLPKKNVTQKDFYDSKLHLDKFLCATNIMEKFESEILKEKQLMMIGEETEIRRVGSVLTKRRNIFIKPKYIDEDVKNKMDFRNPFAKDLQTLVQTTHEIIPRKENTKPWWTKFNKNEKIDDDPPQDSESCCSEETRVKTSKMVLPLQNRKTSKRGIIFAVNSMKEFDCCKQDFGKETKPVSVVILLSKNK